MVCRGLPLPAPGRGGAAAAAEVESTETQAVSHLRIRVRLVCKYKHNLTGLQFAAEPRLLPSKAACNARRAPCVVLEDVISRRLDV